jgi:ribosome maturation factor RimP
MFCLKEWLDHSFFIGAQMVDSMLERLTALAEEASEGLGYEVDDLELFAGSGRTLLRVTIDRPEGVTVDDCAAFSRDFAALLEVEDPIQGKYTLEVTSPGLDRPLKRPEHYEKSVGKLVRVVPREKVAGRNFLMGRLLSTDGKTIMLSVDGEEVTVPLEAVKKARLEPEI